MGIKYLGPTPTADDDMAIGVGPLRKHNFAATVNPTATDDSGSGYGIGSIWVNITTPTVFMCEDDTASSANWLNLSDAGSGIADGDFAGTHAGHMYRTGASAYEVARASINVTSLIPTVNDDTSVGYRMGSIWIQTSNASYRWCVDDTDGAALWGGVHHSTAAPTVNDDSSLAYARGTIWVRWLSAESWVCEDNAVGAADWTRLHSVAASDTVAGEVELATTTETDTGTDATRAVTPDGLAGSIYGQKSVTFALLDDATAAAVAQGTFAFCVPSTMAGMDLIDAVAAVHTTGTTNTMDIQVRRRRAGADVDMLSTVITINSGAQFADDGVINATNDDVNTGDMIYIDVDAIHTTAALGLTVTLTFGTP
jgi:hypothetical protein